MIQLIATDMDGSLLNSRKELPPRFPALLKALHMRGIRFAVSSGRQYTNLLGLFPDLADELIFIAENGAVIFEQGKNIYTGAMREDGVRKLVEEIRLLPGVQSWRISSAFLSGTKSAKSPYSAKTPSIPSTPSCAVMKRNTRSACLEIPGLT